MATTPGPERTPAQPPRVGPARGLGTQTLREAPATPLVLAGVAVLGWLAARSGGYEVATWAPGGAVLLALVVLGVAFVPNAWRALPRSTVVAGVLLAAYCAWSYASIGWAADPGAAWMGANRTVVYLAAFVLFAAWRQRGATAGALLGLWIAVVTVLALIVVVRLLGTDDPRALLVGGRLLAPAGYANASAALLMMACFAAFACAAGRAIAWPLRAVAAGAAVVLADVALLALSRGSLGATAICLLLMLCLLPDRLRRLVTLVPVGGAVALAVPRLLDLTDALGAEQAHAAGSATLLGAAIATLVVGAVALLEARRPPSAALARRAHRAGSVVAAVVLVAAVVVGLRAVGDPVGRVDHAWSSFKGGYAEFNGSRLGSGLGSNRYDFYRVALDTFRDHPVAGVGADNYLADYLRDGRSSETPRYPHSLELRALSETGIVGAVLLFGAIAAALVGAVRAARAGEQHGATRAVAAGAVLATVYWIVHGTADWFFEYAGLGAAAFAFLGLACALDPARAAAPVPVRAPRRAARALVAVACVVPALALLAQWSADRELTRAGAVFATRSGEAYDRLDRARSLDPFSATPDTVAGSIAARLGDPVRARALFTRALDRSPDDQYARLQLGAAQSALGQRRAARLSLERAVALAPRDALAKEALAVVRSGGRIDPRALSARIAGAGDAARG
jgi:O-Antigen ligase/Tetratricopeptide repeat